ncbi:MAG TPA: hydrogenase [Spirochaetaceae bacterium]|nr:hydrogenase [Spirochaetaceae bacterium]HAX36642.1 hydrogenase [Spirochaetaceae bacterium]HBO41029.1 hydrogenase [Spirochaetaceae bacterium]HCQ88044.1 hydrogenase [Spirochaetaceae bacterium]
MKFTPIANGYSIPLDSVPALGWPDFAACLADGVRRGQRVSAYFGAAGARPDSTKLYAILADDEANQTFAGLTEVEGGSFPSLTGEITQLHLFEREIAEQFGLVPVGHPWLKPVRSVRSWTKRDAWQRKAGEPLVPGGCDFFKVEGDEVHEVAVGPVHAGVIEPGHFRFQCHGEEVYHLEIALGYQHRGIEAALLGGPDRRSLHYMETLAGDTTIGHATSYCQIAEALAKCQKTARAQVIRAIGLELERLANHIGDLGALAGDVGYLPTSSFCGRIRGDYLNLTALLCGNRFGRGLLRPGGVGFDVDEARVAEFRRRLAIFKKETYNAIGLLWENQSVMARFEDTGRISKAIALELGLVGPAARASGLACDARCTQPSGIFRFAQIPMSVQDSGDVFARAFVRWLEIQKSIDFIQEQLAVIPAAMPQPLLGPLAPDSLALSINEGWRGEICHVAITDSNGRLARYKVVDPSFHNWAGLAYALRNQEISDFPLCNKSFNLSYCGHDL